MASVGAVVTSDAPIFAERAMYVNAGGTLGGGSASAGSNQLSTQWYFGEGLDRARSSSASSRC